MIQCKQEAGDPIWEKLKAQVARMAQMEDYPRFEPQALRELVLALQHAASMAEAEAVITSFIDTATVGSKCPMAADIRRACNSQGAEIRPDPECKRCSGGGFEIVTRGGYTAAGAKCDCWAPREIRQYGKMRETADRRGNLTRCSDVAAKGRT